MKQILFRPFDFGKWLVIGFTAWLAYIGGGFHFGYRYNKPWEFRRISGWHARDIIQHTPSVMLVATIIVLIVFFLALALLFTWLRARGRFMFTDCVVHNRAAVVEPWREFRMVGNSFFGLCVVVVIVFLFLVGLLTVPFLIGGFHIRLSFHPHGVLLVLFIALWGTMLFVLSIAWTLISHVMIPIMYRRRCLAREALGAAGSLIASYPGEFTLYCLFWIVIALGAGIAIVGVICLTCCIAALPYIGTVILLPIYVWLRAFGLLYLKQFGPDYDVWAGLPAPAPLPGPPPPPPLSV